MPRNFGSISTNDLDNISDEQPRWVGVAATANFKESAYFIHRDSEEELEITNQKCFNHHTIYLGARILFRYIVLLDKFVNSYLIDTNGNGTHSLLVLPPGTHSLLDEQ